MVAIRQNPINIEYRPADATANPYLALASLIRAGLSGLTAGLKTPPLVTGDPSVMTEAELVERGLQRLPQSLNQALDVMANSHDVAAWFHELLLTSLSGVKRAEISILDGKTDDEICALYKELY